MRLAPVAPLMALLALPVLAQDLPDERSGYWTGTGIQSDGQNWEMVLTLYPDGALVDYPGLACAGYWRFAELGETAFSATEHLAAGFDLCEDDLTVRASFDAKGVLTVTWSYDTLVPGASAWLVRD